MTTLDNRPNSALLVVDGVDMSYRAAVKAMTWLRTRLPAVKLLATSRVPVGGEVPGALDWRVEPLEVPAAVGRASMRSLVAARISSERAGSAVATPTWSRPSSCGAGPPPRTSATAGRAAPSSVLMRGT